MLMVLLQLFWNNNNSLSVVVIMLLIYCNNPVRIFSLKWWYFTISFWSNITMILISSNWFSKNTSIAGGLFYCIPGAAPLFIFQSFAIAPLICVDVVMQSLHLLIVVVIVVMLLIRYVCCHEFSRFLNDNSHIIFFSEW